MSRRIDVELTSSREDGTWTWRAAGAKKPKGEISGDLLFDGAVVGDIVRAEADFFIDGITIISITPPKQRSGKQLESLELLGSGREVELVTTELAPKGRGGRDGGRGGRDGGRNERGRGGGRNERGRGGRDGGRNERGGNERGGRNERGGNERGGNERGRNERGGGEGGRENNRPRRDRNDGPSRPKPVRLKPGRKHRNEALKTLAPEMKPLANLLLRGGVPTVRQELDKLNETAKAQSLPPINTDAILSLAEKVYPPLRIADWRDRAEAALATVDTVDLRDLRSVVVASENGAKDEESRALATQLSDAVNHRVDSEHAAWLEELSTVLTDGRTVRALRLSSRPPKAGAPLPTELADRLVAGAAEALTAEASADRYATVLDALAFSPVRTKVKPGGIPTTVTDELTEAVTRLSMRIPDIAAMFGIEPTAVAPKRNRGRGRGKGQR